MTPTLQVAVITGLSGSGKTTALHVLEDLGYYCIDNLPAALIPRFVELCEGGDEISRVAFGVDSRTREFLDQVPRALDEVRGRGHKVEMIYLEAGDDTLVRRFSETRRPHPLAEGSDVASAIVRERGLLATLRAHADRILDTSPYTSQQLRGELRAIFARDAAGAGALQVALVSFGYKFGLPADADLVWDVRFLPNPFYVEDLRPLTGLSEPVADYVLRHPATQQFLDLVSRFLRFALPWYEREGKSYLTVALGCTGGRHRSVVLVERLGRMLQEQRVGHSIRHRDVDR
ncbi:MAG: RNase adapter RapZ [Thermodesulfobacteriota bacterium]